MRTPEPPKGGTTNTSRRVFLGRAGIAVATGALVPQSLVRAAARETFTVRRDVFLPSPQTGVAILASSQYTRPTGRELRSRHIHMSRSDTADRALVRFSPDNGQTWGEAQEAMTVEQRPGGTFRRVGANSFVDPTTGQLLEFRIEGLFADDSPLARLRGWEIHYALSNDGGRTWRHEAPVVQRGAEFSAEHPLPGVWRGKNCAYIGDMGSAPIALADGTIVMPIQIAPLGEDGKLYNPAGGYTYTYAAVLCGRWNPARQLEWEMSSVVKGNPALSTRGMIEPTVAELDGGRLIMVLRGSNDRKPAVRAGRWVSFSDDGGKTWSEVRYWNYTDGGEFFSPSACSQLVPHSSGRLFWLGNITPTNPVGNRPRYPFVIGEVDRRSGGLRKDTVTTVDDRRPGDSELLALSNFYAREDRETGEIVLHMSRLGAKSVGTRHDFTADAYVYRIAVRG